MSLHIKGHCCLFGSPQDISITLMSVLLLLTLTEYTVKPRGNTEAKDLAREMTFNHKPPWKVSLDELLLSEVRQRGSAKDNKLGFLQVLHVLVVLDMLSDGSECGSECQHF